MLVAFFCMRDFPDYTQMHSSYFKRYAQVSVVEHQHKIKGKYNLTPNNPLF